MNTTDPEPILDPTLAFEQLPTDMQDFLADWPARRAASREETTMNQPTTMPTTTPAMTVDWGQLHEELAHPFPDAIIKYRVGAVSRDKAKAQALPYVDVRAYEDRLNTLVPGAWSVEFEPWGEGRIICRLTIYGVTRSSTGEAGDSPTAIAGASAEAQAFKRACSRFGLGRHLYRLTPQWRTYDAANKRLQDEPRTTTAAPQPANESRGAGIGRNRAAAMHIHLARIGLPRRQHESFASTVLGKSVTTLAELLEAEARLVWVAARSTSPRTHHVSATRRPPQSQNL